MSIEAVRVDRMAVDDDAIYRVAASIKQAGSSNLHASIVSQSREITSGLLIGPVSG